MVALDGGTWSAQLYFPSDQTCIDFEAWMESFPSLRSLRMAFYTDWHLGFPFQNHLELIAARFVRGFIKWSHIWEQNLWSYFWSKCWLVFGTDTADINHIQMEIWFASWLIWRLIVANWAKIENQGNPFFGLFICPSSSLCPLLVFLLVGKSPW